ncbi:hypothetical protein [Marivirga sericea]|uniref:hypothetical protein n=1 Tax=Marivirga sericea TaxID=1028 RepID=UPI001592E20E|nr:hypothetical protein [Marivirga sericea]
MSKESRNDLYNRFYKEKNSALIIEFGIKENSNLHRLFEPKIIEEACEYCNVFMWKLYPSKSEQKYGGKKICPKCEHTIYPEKSFSWNTQTCTCNNCERIRLEEIRKEQDENERRRLDEHQKIINKLTSQQGDPITLKDLEYYDMICLLAYLKGVEELSSEVSRFHFFRPFSNLTPTDSLKTDIFKLLLKKNALRINLEVDIDVYQDFIEKDNLDALIDSQSLQLNVVSNRELYSECLESVKNELIKAPNNGYLLWKRIGLHECMEYLNVELASIDLPARLGAVTVQLFEELLQYYSVSQLNKITLRVIERAAKDKLSRVSYDKQIANNTVAGIRSYANKGIVEGWYITFDGIPKKYRKEQSLISKVVFNDVLNIKDEGYLKSPNIEDLEIDKSDDERIRSV